MNRLLLNLFMGGLAFVAALWVVLFVTAPLWVPAAILMAVLGG